MCRREVPPAAPALTLGGVWGPSLHPCVSSSSLRKDLLTSSLLFCPLPKLLAEPLHFHSWALAALPFWD